MKLMSWIWLGVRRQRAMMSIVMLGSVVGTLKGTITARMSTGEVFRHGRSLVKEDVL